MKRGGCWAAGAAPGGKGEDPLPAAEHEEGYFVHLSKFVVSEERCPLIWTKHKFSGQKKSVEDPINFPSDPDSKWFVGKHADCNSFLDFTNSIFQCSGFGQKSPAYTIIRITFKLLELFLLNILIRALPFSMLANGLPASWSKSSEALLLLSLAVMGGGEATPTG